MSEEFKILRVRNRSKLNKKIETFRQENPKYEIFNISVSEINSPKVWVIWRLKK